MTLAEYLELADTVDGDNDIVLKFQIKAYKKLAKKWWRLYYESCFMQPDKAKMYDAKVKELEAKLEVQHG